MVPHSDNLEKQDNGREPRHYYLYPYFKPGCITYRERLTTGLQTRFDSPHRKQATTIRDKLWSMLPDVDNTQQVWCQYTSCGIIFQFCQTLSRSCVAFEQTTVQFASCARPRIAVPTNQTHCIMYTDLFRMRWAFRHSDADIGLK